MHNETTGYARASAGVAKTPEDVSPSRIRDGIGRTEDALSLVQGAITALESRLETVLSPQPPSPVGSAQVKTPAPQNSHVMGRIDILNEGFENAAVRLRDLARRVEV